MGNFWSKLGDALNPVNWIGSAFNMGSTAMTNAQNRKINQDNIAAAYNMQDKANDFSREMFVAQNQEYDRRFQKESDYNSASSQRERLEAAGLNPYLMMDGGSAGVGSSTPASAPSGAAGSVPSSIPMQAMKMEYSMNNVRDMVQLDKDKAQVKTAQAETRIAEANAAVAEEESRARVDEILSRKKKNDSDSNKTDAEANVIQQTTPALVRKAESDVNYTDALIEGQKLSNQMQQAQLPFVEPMAALSLKRSYEDFLNTRETRKLIKANTSEAYKRIALLGEQVISEQLKQEGVRLDNRQRKQLMPIVIENAIMERDQNRYEWQKTAPWIINDDESTLAKILKFTIQTGSNLLDRIPFSKGK